MKLEQRERKREQNEIARILNYYRISMPEGIDLLAADWHESILRQSGLIPRKITLEGAWWKEAFLPMELYGEDDRIYAAVPVGNHYHVWIEEQEKVVDTQLAKQFQRTARCFYKPFSCENKGTGMLWRFLWESIPHTDLIVILVISLFVELCGLLMPYINSVVYNRVIPSGTAREIPGIVVLVISTVIFSTLLSLYKEICRVRLGEKMKVAGQSAVWRRLLQLPAAFFKQYDSGELYQRTDAIEEICNIIGGRMLPAALTAVLSVIYLFQISWFAGELMIPSVVILFIQLCNIAVAGDRKSVV